MSVELAQTPQPHCDLEKANAGWQRGMEGFPVERISVCAFVFDCALTSREYEFLRWDGFSPVSCLHCVSSVRMSVAYRATWHDCAARARDGEAHVRVER